MLFRSGKPTVYGGSSTLGLVPETLLKQTEGLKLEEIEGVGEALTILTDDAARDLFSSTLGFTQVSVTTSAELKAAAVREHLYDVLKAAAKKTEGKSKKGPNPYQLFMKEELARLKKADPKLPHKEAFKKAAANWTKAKK